MESSAASKRANGGGGDAPGTPAKKKSRVKVVASRYAQALQGRNLESQRARRPAEAAPSAAVPKQQPSTARVVPSAHALTKHRASTASAQDSGSSVDLKERLKAFKAGKAPGTSSSTSAAAAASTTATATTTAKPQAAVASKLSAAARERPGFPKRIGGVDRHAKRPAKVASEPTPLETTRPSSAGMTPRARAMSSSCSTGTASSAAAPQTEQEELELLETLYYQLCFTELRAQQAFMQQERSAERQILAAYRVFQSKLQLLHDTALRLDRERHAQLVEQRLAEQANGAVQAASRLPDLVAELSSVCGCVEASLHRLPTRGVRCEPQELQRLLASLGSQLDGLLAHAQTIQLDAKVADAVAFERGMAQAVDAASAALLQVAHLAEELAREADAAASMAVERIQQQRVGEHGAWW